MSAIQNLFEQAQLAEAAYANLAIGEPSQTELIKAGMSPTQAADFASKWIVASTPYNDPTTGVYAVVFQEVSTGQRYLAIRGTEGVTDYLADYFILDGVPSQLNPQYLSLKTQVQQWLGDGTLTPGFTVSGHSLGGYLAAGLVADFSADISHAYLYNAPGNNSAISLVMQALGIAATPDATQITSLRADAGISPIASLGYDFSPPIPITIENQFFSDVSNPPPAMNHSQQVLTDALAVYALIGELSPTLTVGQIGDILKASTAKNAQTLESTVSVFGKLFSIPGATFTGNAFDTNRDLLYTSLDNIKQALPTAGSYQLVSLVDKTSDQIISLAHQDIAYRYALKELNPFAMLGADYSTTRNSANADLVLYDPATGQGLTDSWLTDRAAMLSWKLKAATEDRDFSAPGVVNVSPDSPLPSTDIAGYGSPQYFKDIASGEVLNLSSTTARRMFIFGDNAGNTINGGDYSDHLYGMSGNDILDGKGGDDYLEGGQGNDTLNGGTGANILNGGLGDDTYYVTTGIGNTNQIIDAREADGKLHGRFIVNGQTIATPSAIGGLFLQNGSDTSWTYKGSSGTTSTIGHHSPWKITLEDGSIVDLGDFQDGDYGIRLLDNENLAATFDTTINGDLAPIDQNTSIDGIQLGYDTLGNLITDPNAPEPNRNDTLHGSTGNDLIQGFGGNDTLIADAGDDVLYGQGDDWLDGGAEKQMVANDLEWRVAA